MSGGFRTWMETIVSGAATVEVERNQFGLWTAQLAILTRPKCIADLKLSCHRVAVKVVFFRDVTIQE